MRMASASSTASPCALLPFANSIPTPTSRSFLFFKTSIKGTTLRFRAPAATQDDAECNTEECAPDKEPVVYVAESAISSGSAGTSSSGAENTAAIAAFLGLISIAAASSIILQLGNSPAQIQTTEYSGASLNYYINKFKSEEIIPVSPAPSIVEASAQVQQESPPEDAQLVTPPEDISTIYSITEAEAPTTG